MGWTWRKEHLDIVLVPIGLLIMFGYHLFLVYRCLKVPHATVLGYENQIRSKARKEHKLRLSSLGAYRQQLPSLISLILSSLLGAWLGSPTKTIFTSNLVRGDRSPTTVSIKYIAMLSCFLVAFSSLVQTARCFVHESFLMSTTNLDIPVSYVEKAVITGSNFWSVGVRASYFAITLLLWIFGLIPMFLSYVVMVVVLHNLDSNSTPLHQVQPPPSRDFFKKMDQEMTTWELKQNPSVAQQGNNSI